MEPTSNTEYVSQFATFSELEQMQNMSATMEMQKAFALVGKEVIIRVLDTKTGTSTYERGRVDYVQLEGNKAMLSVNNALYSIDDLDMVPNEDYMKAYDLSQSLIKQLADLPAVGKVNLATHGDAVSKVVVAYAGMTDYQKKFLPVEAIELIKQYTVKLKELQDAANPGAGEA